MQELAQERVRALERIAEGLAAAGAQLTVEAPSCAPLRIGARPEAAFVRFESPAALDALARGDHLALAEAYLQGGIEAGGDWTELIKVTEVIELDESPLERVRMALALLLRGRGRVNADSIAFHYDRPPEFFLPWFERWRSYSHGFYARPDGDPEAAQARKLQHACDVLGLAPGMRVLDMGAGWGSFLEYAGLRGIRVHGITISREQERFLRDLVRERGLPCSVERIDFFAYEPAEPFDGAVFMGTLEHVGDYRRVAAFLAQHLRPGARAYFDFCARRDVFRGGRFMKKWIWPGSATYVDLAALLRALLAEGFQPHELVDDTLSYAYTVRDWARAFEAHRKPLAERFGEPTVRAFGLFLWGSYHFLARGYTQAYHLVVGREPRERHATSASDAVQSAAKASPNRA